MLLDPILLPLIEQRRIRWQFLQHLEGEGVSTIFIPCSLQVETVMLASLKQASVLCQAVPDVQCLAYVDLAIPQAPDPVDPASRHS
jgi:hypothetical protein